ncbi:MAG: hypothetical protein ACR2GW_03870, partial [Pyrinomonadaceae bacterium]
MILDWQNVAVILIVLAAVCYVGRRGWRRLRSFVLRKGEGKIDSLAASCGSCAGNQKPKNVRPLNVLVQ